MPVVEPFGFTDQNQPVHKITLTNAAGNSVSILSYGCAIQSIAVPGRDGLQRNVTLGYETLEQYQRGICYFGAVVGRFANRIGDGGFTLDGTFYPLERNNGPNHLHGGSDGFHRQVYAFETGADFVRFTRRSPNGEAGYPGQLNVEILYRWTDGNALQMEFTATTDAPTLVNLANHAYFNLSGAGTNGVLDHELTIHAARFTEIDDTCLTTGIIAGVAETPFDFRVPKAIGCDILASDTQLQNGGGYDHNFVLDGTGLRVAATALSPVTGIKLTLSTDQPGLQFYSGNFITAEPGLGGDYHPHSGFCLEAQLFPNAPACPDFPSAVLRPGERYCQTTIYQFSVQA